MFKKYLFISIFFILVTIILTYPLVFKINNGIAGWHTTDEPFAALWNFWWFKYAFKHHLTDTYYSIISVPFGFDVGKTTLYPLWNFFYKWLSILTNHFISFNIQVLLSVILAGITMYCLVFYLTRENFSSLLSGVIYAFCPYHFARAWQHLGLAQIQWMPLYILTLIKLKDYLTYKNMFLSILGLFLVISFEFHYAYFMYIVTIIFLFYNFFYYKKINSEYLRLLKLVFVIMIIGIFFVLPSSATTGLRQILLEKKVIRPSVWSAVKPFEDLFAQSARPLSYFLPATAHPFFGNFTERFVGSSLYGVSFTEHTLYLGWIPLILAFAAFKTWRKSRKLQVTYNDKDFYIGFFVFLSIVAWFFSQPPWWKLGPLKIYMPSFFMYKIVPIIRAYCRFGIVVMLAVAVLAGFGMKFLLERFKAQKIKITIITLLCSLVLFEFWNYPPFKVIDVSNVPEVYYWLKEQPKDFVVAEYPLDIDGANEIYKFYQTKHEKKIINGTIPGTYANRVARSITRLSDQNTAEVLKWMGVKYVLVHKEDYLKTDLIEDREELDTIPNNPALKFTKHFPAQECPQKDIMCIQRTGSIDVYEVIAQPVKPKL